MSAASRLARVYGAGRDPAWAPTSFGPHSGPLLGSWGWRLHRNILVPPTLSPTSELLGQLFPSRHPWPEGVQTLPPSLSPESSLRPWGHRGLQPVPMVMESKVQHRAEPGWMGTLEGTTVARVSLLGASLTDLPSLTLTKFLQGGYWSENSRKSHCDDHLCPQGLGIPREAGHTFSAVIRALLMT